MPRARWIAILLLAGGLAHAADPKPSASVLDPKVTGLSSDEAEILGDTVREATLAAGKYRVQDRGAMREILAQQQFNWTLQRGTPGDESGSDIAVDAAKNLYVTGFTKGAMDGNTLPVTTDLLLIKCTQP